jgi:hypothetical protein
MKLSTGLAEQIAREFTFDLGNFLIQRSPGGVWQLMVQDFETLVDHNMMSWRPITVSYPSFLCMPHDQLRWSAAQTSALIENSTAHFAANPDDPTQSWLTLALNQVHQYILDWLDPLPSQSGCEKIGLTGAEVSWVRVAQGELIGLQKIQTWWAIASLLAQQISPSSSDQACVDKITEDVINFSSALHAWVGADSFKVLQPIQVLMNQLACPPRPFKAVLDKAILIDHLKIEAPTEAVASPRSRRI